MVVEVSDKDLNKLAEKMMAQLKTEGDVDAFTKALRKQFWGKRSIGNRLLVTEVCGPTII